MSDSSLKVEIETTHTDEFGREQTDVLTLEDFRWANRGVLGQIAEGLCIRSLRIYRDGALDMEFGEWDDLDARGDFWTAAADRYL